MVPAWLGFLIVIGIIMALSKYELGILLSAGAFLFALLTGIDMIASLLNVLLNPSILVLMIVVALIPILGGIMEESGLMMEMLDSMQVSKKTSLMAMPALFGLLPVPGGALMSAPIVEQIDSEVEATTKVSINVWYRHMLILIYPLTSALIVASYLSKINLYVIVVVLLPSLIIMWFIGYFTLVRDIDPYQEKGGRDLKKAFHNLLPIIIAPIIDILGRTFFDLSVPEIFLLIGLMISIWVAIKFANMEFSQVKTITKKMKIWRFPLLIFAMFWFLEVFIYSGAPEEIASINLSVFLFILIGFFLGFATGRIQLPFSILVPIYFVQFTFSVMPIFDFVFIYTAIFLGYLITPIHPCVSYSTEYFKTDFKHVFKTLSKPTFISFAVLIGLYLLFIMF